MLKTNIDKIKKQLEQNEYYLLLLTYYKKLEKNNYWIIFLAYYKKFDAKGNAVMDELEANVAKKKKEFFAQNDEEYKLFYRDVKIISGFAYIIWLNLVVWSFVENPNLSLFGGFVPFFDLKFPESHIYRFEPFDYHLGPFVDKPYRYYKPLAFKLDLYYFGLPMKKGLFSFLLSLVA